MRSEEFTAKLSDVFELSKKFGDIEVRVEPWFPKKTIMVSPDIYDALKQIFQARAGTIEGEVVREAKKQLEEGNDDLQVCRETRLGGGD